MKKYCTKCYNVLFLNYSVQYADCRNCTQYVVVKNTKEEAQKFYHTYIFSADSNVKSNNKKWNDSVAKFLKKWDEKMEQVD